MEARERRLVGGEKRGRETFLKGFVVSDKVCHRCFGGEDWTERVWTAHVARCALVMALADIKLGSASSELT